MTLLISYLNGFGADGEGEGSQGSGVGGQDSAEGEAAADAALPTLASSPAATPMANQQVQDDVLALLAADVASQPKRRTLT